MPELIPTHGLEIGYDYKDISIGASWVADQIYAPTGSYVTGGGFICWDLMDQPAPFDVSCNAPAPDSGWQVAGYPTTSGKLRIWICYILNPAV